MKISFETYMDGIFKLCEKRVDDDVFINLRLWNLDENGTENAYNQKIFKKLSDYFKVVFPQDILTNPPKSIRLAKKYLYISIAILSGPRSKILTTLTAFVMD